MSSSLNQVDKEYALDLVRVTLEYSNVMSPREIVEGMAAVLAERLHSAARNPRIEAACLRDIVTFLEQRIADCQRTADRGPVADGA